MGICPIFRQTRIGMITYVFHCIVFIHIAYFDAFCIHCLGHLPVFDEGFCMTMPPRVHTTPGVARPGSCTLWLAWTRRKWRRICSSVMVENRDFNKNFMAYHLLFDGLPPIFYSEKRVGWRVEEFGNSSPTAAALGRVIQCRHLGRHLGRVILVDTLW